MNSLLRILCNTFIFAMVTFSSFGQGGVGLDLTWPINNSVTQRSSINIGVVTIAGQLLTASGVTLPSSLTYKINNCSATGVPGTSAGTGSLTLGVAGVFHNAITISKGWYILQIEGILPGNTTPTPLWYSKFGVGDVFVMAGQSNAKGVGLSSWDVPSTSSLPEWIVSVNEGSECRMLYPSSSYYSFTKISENNRIAPTGENSWCYTVLGKLISDANGGMPVAFFNTAYGGSAIRNWYESRAGGATNDLYTGVQYCADATSISPIPSYFAGQPFTTLKNTLNYYTSMFGVRAVLWHQGEVETAQTTAEGANTQTYKDYLDAVILQSRSIFNTNLSWIIARASYNMGNTTGTVVTAQTNVAAGTNNFVGPNTDLRTSAYRDLADNTHFKESRSSGLTTLANDWKAQIDASGTTSFSRIVAGSVPSITVTKSGTNRTVTAPTGANEYRWGLDVNTAVSSGTTNSKAYTSPGGLIVRCFARYGNNWTASARVTIGTGSSCMNCKENFEQTAAIEEEKSLVNFYIYPNPAISDVNVEFNVLQPDFVTLELIDANGKVLRTIANGPHATGLFKYPVYISKEEKGINYFCRVTIGQTAYTKRLVLVGGDQTKL